MSFLKECRKAEDGVGKVKAKGKIKSAAATTSSPSYSDAFSKQHKKQQQQFDALMGKVQAMVTTLGDTMPRPHPHLARGTLHLG